MAGYRQLECDVAARRARVLDTEPPDALDGIDYLEVSAETWNDQRFLHVHFLRETKGESAPAGLVGEPDQFRIRGGVRERGIRILDVTAKGLHLVVEVDRAGDFSTYTLEIPDFPGLDPAFRAVDFSFKAGCRSRYDCQPREICPPEEAPEPVIDYMARDYASFRRALIDLIPTWVPEWTDRHAADLGMALIEILAYAGDDLSYQLDAVSNELHLESARQRISVRRHARLIDYPMHDGASAWTFVHFEVDQPGAIPARTVVLSRIEVPLDTEVPPHGEKIDPELKSAAFAAADAVFETLGETEHQLKDGVKVDPRLNEIPIHPWGDEECCLPIGTTEVTLRGDLTSCLEEDDFLLFEEALGPVTGRKADADPAHRQVVRLRSVEKEVDDPLFLDSGANPEPLTRVTWDEADALAFPLCLSARGEDGRLIDGVSVARGNLVLADHGFPVEKEKFPGFVSTAELGRSLPRRFRLREGPLSFRVLPPTSTGPRPSVASFRDSDPRLARPEIRSLEIDGKSWRPTPDPLRADAFDRVFVVETDNAGKALVRFGDGRFGRVPPDGEKVEVTYRVGVGTAGNVGSDALVHVLDDTLLPKLPKLVSVRNPLPARGGVDPEPIERVKQLAPPAMHAEQYRAVTEEDYARAAEDHPDVAKAEATFRWTGSWHTVFVTVDRCGGREVTPAFERAVRAHLERSRLAGYDLQIDAPRYVPLEVEIEVCAAPGHFRAHVAEALEEALSSWTLPGGRRGFFHPDEFTFGQTLYLSRLYSAIEAVAGVDSGEVRLFRRWGTSESMDLDRGYMTFGRLEIARLDNDPNFPENGSLRIDVQGGK